MLRAIFVISLIVLGIGVALRGPFYALLFYTWLAYFRPEGWIWSDFLNGTYLSFIVGTYLLARTLFSSERLHFDGSTALLILILAHALVSTLLSQYVDYSWPHWQNFAKSILVTYVIIVLISGRVRYRQLLLVLTFSLGFEATKQGYAQMILLPGQKNFNSIPGFGDENDVAVCMLMLVPILASLGDTAIRKWERYLCWFVAVGVLYRAITTYSRGGFLACGAVLAFYVARSRQRARTILGVVLVGALILPILPQEFWNRMGTITASDEEQDTSAKTRLHLWAVALEMGRSNPLVGIGFNAYNAAYESHDFSGGEFGHGRAVHNSFLGAFAELGYPGLLLFCTILGVAMFKAVRVGRVASRNPGLEALASYAIALQASFVAFIVGGIFVTLQYREMLWHFIGLSFALSRVLANELEQSATTAKIQPAPVTQTFPVACTPTRAPVWSRSSPSRVGSEKI